MHLLSFLRYHFMNQRNPITTISTGLVVLRSENDGSATEAIGFGCLMGCSCVWWLMGIAGLIWSVVFGILILVGDVPDGSGYFPIDASCVPVGVGA